MTDDKNTLKYKDLSLHIAADVWHELERVKLHDWKLEEPDAPVRLFIPNAPIVGGAAAAGQQASSKKLSMASFVPEGLRNAEATLENHHSIPGILKNFNTVNQLTDLDATQRQALLTAAAQKLLLKDLVDRNSPWWTKPKPATTTTADKDDPFYFSPVVSVVFTFADLKTHEFHYCAAFPTIDLRSIKSPVTVASRLTCSVGIAKAIGGDNTTTAVLGHVKSVRLNLRAPAGAPFVIDTKNGAILPFHSSTVTPADLASGQHVVAFLDSVGSGEYPGWAARNIITAIRLTHPATTTFQLLALRGPLAEDLGDDSIMFSCTCNPLAESVLSRLAPNSEDPLPSIGWVEKSITKINMGGVMDSVQLATSSAKLNLSLMKWRMLPELQLEPLQGCKALLLGSGTLGCNIGRHLLMWGVTHLTFVDRGNV
ncbi:ubiquitin activating E1 enzyme, putative, partial [Bodo saltans]